MEAKFIYEIEHTEWVSPIVVAPKKNGKLRVCVNLKKVNATSEPGNQARSGCLRLVHLTCQAHVGDTNVGGTTLFLANKETKGYVDYLVMSDGLQAMVANRQT